MPNQITMNIVFAEFIGTFLMMLLGLGVNANVALKGTKGSYSSASAWVLICADGHLQFTLEW